MTKKETDIIQSLIAGGVIGAALGSLLSKNKGAGSVLGAFAGAAILASAKAYESSQNTGIPLVVEEHGALYEVHADGRKKFLKDLPSSGSNIPKKFILK